MFKENIPVKNGDMIVYISYFICDDCGEDICESDYYSEQDDKHYCRTCSFKKGLFDEKTYLNSIGFDDDMFKAGINPTTNEIEVIIGNKFSWEMKSKEIRNSNKYIEWRKNVFERDDYTCQICGKIGGELNAHHKKSFSKYEDLRFTLSNGITLCKECHIELHKQLRKTRR